jgi:hypothetical protein
MIWGDIDIDINLRSKKVADARLLTFLLCNLLDEISLDRIDRDISKIAMLDIVEWHGLLVAR